MGNRFASACFLPVVLLLAACGGSGGGSVTTRVSVTASGTNVSITPNTTQPFNGGGSASYTVVAATGYTRSNTVGGTCPGGSFAGATYTTGAVTADCTVVFSATLNSYTVTPSGTHVSVTPNTAQSVNHGATRAFTVVADANYTRSDAVSGTCPAGSWAAPVYTTGPVTQACTVSFSATVTPTTLSSSVAALALRTDGVPRTITIANTGAATAFAVSYAVTLPAGTTITPAACGDIVAAASCLLTVTPGSAPSAAPGDTNPAPVTLTIAGSNTNTLSPGLAVVTLGSTYQSGYLFAIDESTPNTGGIGGKVAALVDQAPPYPNGSPWSDIVVIQGVNEDSTNPPDACDGAVDGACNSAVIVAANSLPARDPPLDPSTYAAGLCTATIGGYSDWYLPAACEMGYGAAGCGSALSPLAQNMRSNLLENGDIGNLAGSYWTSTQFSADPAVSAWSSFFDPGGSSTLIDDPKGLPLGVRCARAVTP